MRRIIFIIVISCCAHGRVSAEGSQTATVVFKSGKVMMFANPRRTADGEPPRVLFESYYYTERKVKRGDKIKLNEILWTGSRSRAKVVFENGDQIILPSNSAYKIGWDKAKKQKKPSMTFYQGVLRMVVGKGGERSDLEIKSKTIALGIRGTDFYFKARNNEGEAELSVLRGKVDVWHTNAVEPKAVEISSGYSAKIGVKRGGERINLNIALSQTSKSQVANIRRSTSVPKRKAVGLTASETRHLLLLDKMAVQGALNDIKTNDPVFYQKNEEELTKFTDSESLDDYMLAKMKEDAPSEEKYNDFLVSYKAREEIREANKEVRVDPIKQLSILASKEKKLSMGHLWPALTSGFLTMGLGYTALNEKEQDLAIIDEDKERVKQEDRAIRVKRAGKVAMAIGAASLIANTAFGIIYTPYTDCHDSLSKHKEFERRNIASECIISIPEVGNTLSWASSISGFLASIYVISEARENPTRIVGGVSLVFSLSPLLFRNFWHSHRDEAKESEFFNLETTLFQGQGGDVGPMLVGTVEF